MNSNLQKVSIIILFLLVFAGVEYYSFIRKGGGSVLPQNISNPTTDWTEKNDIEKGIYFKYPTKLPTTYITATDWPPVISIFSGPITCNEVGEETALGGRTIRKEVNGKTYCVTVTSEGAAGSTYNQYAYATLKDNKILVLTFTARLVQCGNYVDFQKNDCETERKDFDLDKIVDQMVGTLKFI